MSFDQWSHEINPIKLLHEILQCLLTSGLMKITQLKCYMTFSNVFWPEWSHENNTVKILHEILKCLWTNGLTRHDKSDKGSKWENDSNQIGDVTHNFKSGLPKIILTPLVMVSSFWEEDFIVIFLL